MSFAVDNYSLEKVVNLKPQNCTNFWSLPQALLRNKELIIRMGYDVLGRERNKNEQIWIFSLYTFFTLLSARDIMRRSEYLLDESFLEEQMQENKPICIMQSNLPIILAEV